MELFYFPKLLPEGSAGAWAGPGRISSFFMPWEQKGTIWEALVIWKHRVAEAAARHARRGKQPSGISRWCISHRSPLPRDNKQGQTWGWEQGKQQSGHKERGKEMQTKCYERQMTFPTFEDDKCWTLGSMIWVNTLRPYFRQGFIKAGFVQSFHSEWNLLLSVTKPRQVCRRETLLHSIIHVVS